MHPFDKWLLERLVASGALCLGDPLSKAGEGIRLYQDSKGMTPTGRLDDITIWELRRDQGARPGAQHVICLPVPSRIGSEFEGAVNDV